MKKKVKPILTKIDYIEKIMFHGIVNLRGSNLTSIEATDDVVIIKELDEFVVIGGIEELRFPISSVLCYVIKG